MSQLLISRSPDLKRLRDEGYDLEVKSNHLLVNGVPYVNARREVRHGTLVSELTLAGGVTTKPGTHVALFIGEHPCNRDGSEIAQIKHSTGNQDLGNGLVVNHAFSNKPRGGYPDYYAKMTRYTEIISNPARAIDPSVTAMNFSPVPPGEEESVFNYFDTASSRAGITAVTAKLALGRVGIVGLGGTGSYVLDVVAKTPVREIHLFDGDRMLNHNAFRAPGAPSIEQLAEKQMKVFYYRDIYSRMRRGIIPHDCYIDASNVEQLRGMDFVFLCLDRGGEKRRIVERLREWGIPFVDVGMGVELHDGALGGVLRVTAATPAKGDHVSARIPFADDAGGDDYSRNIQIADLNALNAALAVIRWKKLFGFYRDLDREHHSTYTIDGNMLLNEDKA
jgi:hypothetical protein